MRLIDSEKVEKIFTEWLNSIPAGEETPTIEACLDVVKNMPTLTQPNDWVSVEERPPEFPGFLDHITVVTCDKNGYVMPMVRERTLAGYEWVERWLYPWNKIYDGPEIIYWTSLPKPPKGGD